MFVLELLLLRVWTILLFARTAARQRKPTGGFQPRKKLSTKAARRATTDSDGETSDAGDHDEQEDDSGSFLDHTSYQHDTGEIIPCEFCGMGIPFPRYQQHINNHIRSTSSTTSKSNSSPTPHHFESRRTRSATSTSTSTSSKSISTSASSPSSSSSSPSSSPSSRAFAAGPSHGDHYDDVVTLLNTSTSAYCVTNKQEHIVTTAHIHDEKMFTHQQLPHPPTHRYGACRISLRSPLQHEPGYHTDVVFCLLTGKKTTNVDPGYRPHQPEDDSLVFLPMLGTCRFVGFAPFCLKYSSKTHLQFKTHWRFRGVGTRGARMGTIVDVVGMVWPKSKLPVRLLIDINNINGYLPLNSTWRADITHFVLFHQLHSRTDTTPSLLCQIPRCPNDPIHYSHDQPMLGICADHLSLVSTMGEHDYRYPPEYSLQKQLSLILYKMNNAMSGLTSQSTTSTTTSISTSASTSTLSLPQLPARRCSRRISFHLVTMLTKEENKNLDTFLHKQVENRYHEGAGNIVLLYSGLSPARNSPIFQEYIDLLTGDIDASCIDVSRFFKSSHFILFISLTMHSDGGGVMIFGYGKRIQTSTSSSVCIDLSNIFNSLPSEVNCPIVLCVGSCTHSYDPYITLHEQVRLRQPHVAKHLHLLYCAGDAPFSTLSNLQLAIIMSLMSDDTMNVPKAFSTIAGQLTYEGMAPRLVCPDQLIIVPHSIQPTKEIIPRYLLHPLSAPPEPLFALSPTPVQPHPHPTSKQSSSTPSSSSSTKSTKPCAHHKHHNTPNQPGPHVQRHPDPTHKTQPAAEHKHKRPSRRTSVKRQRKKQRFLMLQQSQSQPQPPTPPPPPIQPYFPHSQRHAQSQPQPQQQQQPPPPPPPAPIQPYLPHSQWHTQSQLQPQQLAYNSQALQNQQYQSYAWRMPGSWKQPKATLQQQSYRC